MARMVTRQRTVDLDRGGMARRLRDLLPDPLDGARRASRPSSKPSPRRRRSCSSTGRPRTTRRCRSAAIIFHHALNSIIIAGGSTLLAMLIAIPAAWSMAFAPDQADQGHPALDAVDQDDAAGRRAGADLSDLQEFRPARHSLRSRLHPLSRQSADRGLDALHLFQGNPEGHPGGGADGRRDHRPRAGLCADADGGAGARVDDAA